MSGALGQVANPCRIEWWNLDPEKPGPWVNAYMKPAIPFAERGRTREGGIDCWGLLRLVYREQLGIVLPDYSGDYASTADRAELARLIAREKGDWVPVWESRVLQGLKPLGTAIEAPPKGAIRPFDGILIPIVGEPCHVGVAIGGGDFIHAEDGSGPAVQSLSELRWRRRLSRGGVYRHRALMETER